MDDRVNDYFSEASNGIPRGNFYRVIDLSEDVDVASEDLCCKVQGLSKGWVELARLSREDRLEFSKEFWLSKFLFHPRMLEALGNFFSLVEDIGVFIVQKKKNSPFEAHLVYSLKEQRGFFHGRPPADPEILDALVSFFPEYHLPDDYLAFLRIHNGFAKATDTGLFPAEELLEKYTEFQRFLDQEAPLLLGNQQIVNPKTLLPFYQSFGMPVYQCFWVDWYPEQEMGNVYYSGFTHTLSETDKKDVKTESLAFPTFADWLFFYLEIITD